MVTADPRLVFYAPALISLGPARKSGSVACPGPAAHLAAVLGILVALPAVVALVALAPLVGIGRGVGVVSEPHDAERIKRQCSQSSLQPSGNVLARRVAI